MTVDQSRLTYKDALAAVFPIGPAGIAFDLRPVSVGSIASTQWVASRQVAVTILVASGAVIASEAARAGTIKDFVLASSAPARVVLTQEGTAQVDVDLGLSDQPMAPADLLLPNVALGSSLDPLGDVDAYSFEAPSAGLR